MQKFWHLAIGYTNLLLLSACQGKQIQQVWPVQPPPEQTHPPAPLSNLGGSPTPKVLTSTAVPLKPEQMPVVAIDAKPPIANLQRQLPPPLPLSSSSQRDPFAANLPNQLGTIPAAQSTKPHARPMVAPPQVSAVLPSLNTPAAANLTSPKRRSAAAARSWADTVHITGVVQAGNRTLVIAKAADEPTVRYLQAGDYLSGGKIRVKAIRLESQSEPEIILQQNGVEVTKRVGE